MAKLRTENQKNDREFTDLGKIDAGSEIDLLAVAEATEKSGSDQGFDQDDKKRKNKGGFPEIMNNSGGNMGAQRNKKENYKEIATRAKARAYLEMLRGGRKGNSSDERADLHRETEAMEKRGETKPPSERKEKKKFL